MASDVIQHGERYFIFHLREWHVKRTVMYLSSLTTKYTPGASMKKRKNATNLKMEIKAKSDRINGDVGVIESKRNEVSRKESPHWQIFSECG